MIEETGIVERLSESNMDVRIIRPEQCETCAIRENCYNHGNVLSVPVTSGIRESDRVRVTITNTSVLGLSALMYGVPLVAVLLGIILGYYLFFPSLTHAARILATLGSGGGFLAVAAFVVHKTGKRISTNIQYKTELIGASEESE